MPNKPNQGQISVLVLSPTRELALQIKVEAQMLLEKMGGAFGVQHCVGGTNVSSQSLDQLWSRLTRNLSDTECSVESRESLTSLSNLSSFYPSPFDSLRSQPRNVISPLLVPTF